MKVLENNPKLAEIESRLNKFPYLSKNSLPGYPDAKIFQTLETAKRYPDRKMYPNFYYWYILIKQFSASSINKWANDEIYLDTEDSLVMNFSLQAPVRKESLPPLSSLGAIETVWEAGSQEVKTPRQEPTTEIEYIIDITPKTDSTDSIIQTLKKELVDYKVDIQQMKENNQVRLVFKMEAAKCQELKDKVSKSIEFSNLQVKKEKRMKTMIFSKESSESFS